MALRLTVAAADGHALPEPLRYDIEQARVTLGRGAGADVRLPHATVSEQHALLRLEQDGYSIVDNESTNGTRVNGDRLVPGRRKKLRDGDRIDVGIYTLAFEGTRLVTETITAERSAEFARRLFRASQRGTQIGEPRLVVLGGPSVGKSVGESCAIPPPPSRLVAGRAETCELVLADPDVSREHAEVVRDLDGVTIKNLGSKNGVVVQGQVVQQRRLRDGDELLLGRTRLLFEEPADQPLLALAQGPDRVISELPSEVETRTLSAPVITSPPDPSPAIASVTESPRTRGLDADTLIYALAAAVIAISVAGILFLMRAS